MRLVISSYFVFVQRCSWYSQDGRDLWRGARFWLVWRLLPVLSLRFSETSDPPVHTVSRERCHSNRDLCGTMARWITWIGTDVPSPTSGGLRSGVTTSCGRRQRLLARVCRYAVARLDLGSSMWPAGKEGKIVMSTARPSVTKRQREQTKRDRKLKKAEKRAERKNNPRPDETEAIVSDNTEIH